MKLRIIISVLASALVLTSCNDLFSEINRKIDGVTE